MQTAIANITVPRCAIVVIQGNSNCQMSSRSEKYYGPAFNLIVWSSTIVVHWAITFQHDLDFDTMRCWTTDAADRRLDRVTGNRWDHCGSK